MGASVFGRDVDPIAVAIVGSELQGPVAAFESASELLVNELNAELGAYFAGPDPDWIPLHWFWLWRPTCGHCGQAGLLYKDLIIATSSGKRGAVVRDDKMHAFCPDCLTVHPMDLQRQEVHCCGRHRKIRQGMYERGKYHCSNCGRASSHEDLGTAQAERVLVAVEETHVGLRRRIRTASNFDRDLAANASARTGLGSDFDIPLESNRRDRRPVSAGFTSTRTLFTPRQWVVFTSAFTKVRTSKHQPDLERELTLMLTGSLTSNNVLCGYARDWGRLAPLFSVRGFSLPALMVELNPFHPTGGRGTFKSARSRMMERADVSVRRGRVSAGGIERGPIDLPVQAASVDITCRSADDSSVQTDCAATICVTDPPYFDYIAYSELSEFFRAWLPNPELVGAPLLPAVDSPIETFSIGLGGALKVTLTRLRPGTPLVFTYHSASYDAWRAIGDAFDIAGLAVVALWPVLADPHMGHHTAEGNCEWDVVVVARRREEVVEVPPDKLDDMPTKWLWEIEGSGLTVGRGDRASFEHAWSIGKPRFAVLGTHEPAKIRHRPVRPRGLPFERDLRSRP
jgi:hypothetical protein